MWTFTLPYIGNEKVFQINAMAVSFGKLEEFDTANSDDWVQYIEHMEHYFLTNEITDASKQRSTLISSMGQKAYSTRFSGTLSLPTNRPMSVSRTWFQR